MISLWKNENKRLKDIWIVFFLLLLLQLIISLSTTKTTIITQGTFILIIIAAVMVIPLKLFSYVFNQTQSSHINSMPYTKNQLFLIKYGTGIVGLTILTLLYVLANIFFQTNMINTVPSVINILICLWLYYSLSCFILQITGNMITYISIVILLMVMPILLYMSLHSMFGVMVKGFVVDNYQWSIVSFICPIFRLSIDAVENNITPLGHMIIYIGYFVVSLIGALYAFKKRPLEKVGEGFVFPWIGRMIKVLICTSASWFIASLVISSRYVFVPSMTSIADGYQDPSMIMSQNQVMMVMVFISFLFTIISFMKKGQHLPWRNIIIQGIGIAGMSIVIFFTSSKVMTEYVPNNVDMVSITIGEYYNLDMGVTDITNQDAIAEIQKLHTSFINDGVSYDQSYQAICFSYSLPNGDIMQRQYSLDVVEFEKVMTTIAKDDALLEGYLSTYEVLAEDLIEQNEKINILAYNHDEHRQNEQYGISSITLGKAIQLEVQKWRKNPILLTEMTLDIMYTVQSSSSYHYNINVNNKDILYKVINNLN